MDFSQIQIDVATATALAARYYDFHGEISPLPGEVDFNFYLKNELGEYTLKISRPDTSEVYIDFQVKIINFLTKGKFPLSIPSIVPASDGRDYISLDEGRFVRMQKWVNGTMLDQVQPRSESLLQSWGQTAGLFSKYLQEFEHPGAHRLQKWDPSKTLQAKIYLPYFQSDEEKEIAVYFWNLFETYTEPALVNLRKSVNYNDAHEHNLLISGDRFPTVITGVIDFGDALYTETINELAIACAYAAMYLPDPLQGVVEVIKGYQAEFSLAEAEISVLYSLISARLLLTVANAAWNKFNEPQNKYLLISEKPAWDLLKKWRNISPDFAHYRFRAACGWEACPKNPVFRHWLSHHRNEIYPVIPIGNQKWMDIDLSVGSKILGNNPEFDRIGKFVKLIDRTLEDNGAQAAIGGYGEIRPFYTTDAYRMEGNSGSRWRTVHLGVDLWTREETNVYAPLDGVIFSVYNNAGECNYGPTIIIKHDPHPDLTFFTLYGHLSAESLDGWRPGQKIRKGQQVGKVGSPPLNGNWPPHLHFQIMLDRLGQQFDFPGVAYPEEADTWLSICPEAYSFFDWQAPLSGKYSVRELIEKRNKLLGKSLSISYQKPLYMVRGFMQHLYDIEGRRYLDTVNNVPHVGHQHPAVVKVAQQQIAVLNTNTRYLHENIIEFADQLLSTFPPELEVVYFVNSGSEANELALRMVETYTGSKEMMAVEVGYHGNTNRCIEVSSYKFDGSGGQGAPPFTHVIPLPDLFRGLYTGPEAGIKYASHAAQAIENIKAAGRKMGGFICESILSCGGQIVLPSGYLTEVYRLMREAGGLCIADEVQVGLGRVGDHFWGFELQEVVPDIVTIGKPVGNGHPLGAVVTSRKVADTFANGMEYFNTFGGNPVSCAIGREVLKVMKEDGLQQSAKETGIYLIQGLSDLKDKYGIIGDVRGHGLFIGVELIKDQANYIPAKKEAHYLINRMRERGILMSTDGPDHNVIKIKPPMCFDRCDADFLLSNLEKVFSESYFQ